MLMMIQKNNLLFNPKNNMEVNYSKIYLGIIVFLSIGWYINNSNLNEKNLELRGEIYSLETEVEELETNVSDYEDALQQANDNIEEAKGSAWGTYHDMGDALDTLEIVEI